jgi:hypothetical protein
MLSIFITKTEKIKHLRNWGCILDIVRKLSMSMGALSWFHKFSTYGANIISF